MRTKNPTTGPVALPGAPTESNQPKQPWTVKVGTLPWKKSEVAGKRVRITHLDGKLPNLCLMKLSHWFKANGAAVTFSKAVSRELFEGQYDLVLASSIFNWSVNAREIFAHNFPNAIIGGTGTQDATSAEQFVGEDIDGTDYSIYPHFDASIGFSQRGCRLRCSFCVVPKKEGKVAPQGNINSIWRGPGHAKKIILLDNDFFGQPDWKARCDELMQGDFEVSLNQGINVRLIHAEGAAYLAKLKYRDDQFKVKRIYTAWDNRRDEEIFLRGIRLLTNAGINPKNIMVYFLCGYWVGEQWQDILYRFNTMTKLGLMPYPMVFDNQNKMLKKFQSWVIRRYYQFVPWEEYDLSKLGTAKEDERQIKIFDE